MTTSGPRTRTERVGGLVLVAGWCALWSGVFLVVGDQVARWVGATGATWTAVAVVVPALLALAWGAVVVRAVRAVARRRRLLEQEFTE